MPLGGRLNDTYLPGQQGQLDDVSCTATGPDEGITSPEQTTKNESLVSLDRKLGDMEMNGNSYCELDN